jgi:hypothetical protein
MAKHRMEREELTAREAALLARFRADENGEDEETGETLVREIPRRGGKAVKRGAIQDGPVRGAFQAMVRPTTPSKRNPNKPLWTVVVVVRDGKRVIGEFVPSMAAMVASLYDDKDLQAAHDDVADVKAANGLKAGREKRDLNALYANRSW